MSQIVACKNRSGIVMAADSHAVDFNAQGQMVDRPINRLVQLTDKAAILTSGAPEGEKMCLALKSFLTQEKLSVIEDIYSATLPFLASEYERFMRTKCETLPLAIHHVNFILGGASDDNERNPFRLYLLWTKKKQPLLDGDEIDSALAVPRMMRLEYKLHQLQMDNDSLEDMLTEIQTGLTQQANIQEDIAAPFTYALITLEGFKAV